MHIFSFSNWTNPSALVEKDFPNSLFLLFCSVVVSLFTSCWACWALNYSLHCGKFFCRFTFKDFVDRFRFLVSGIGPAHKVGNLFKRRSIILDLRLTAGRPATGSCTRCWSTRRSCRTTSSATPRSSSRMSRSSSLNRREIAPLPRKFLSFRFQPPPSISFYHLSFVIFRQQFEGGTVGKGSSPSGKLPLLFRTVGAATGLAGSISYSREASREPRR